MYCASRPSLEAETDSDRSVDSGVGSLLSTERVVGVDRSTGYLTNFAGELEKQKVHRQIGENVGAGQILYQRHRTSIRGWSWRNRTRRYVRADVGRRVVLVLAETGCQAEQQQALAADNSPGFGFQAEIVYVKRVTAAGAGEVHGRQVAHEIADRYARNQQRLLQNSNSRTVTQLE